MCIVCFSVCVMQLYHKTLTAIVSDVYCISKNASTLASHNFGKHRVILVSFVKQHWQTFSKYIHIQLYLSLYFCLLSLPLHNCDRSDVKLCIFLGRLMVILKRAGFISADVQSDVLSPSRIGI